MITRASVWAAAIGLAGTMGASAQETCGGLYKVQSGDSLTLIADRLYKDVGLWSTIYRTNLERIPSPDAIQVGQTYRMPCVNGLPLGLPGGTPLDQVAQVEVPAVVPAAPEKVQEQRARAEVERKQGVDVRLLAGDDFKPFTNRMLPDSGMITDLVNRAFINNDDTGQHKFYWVNDRAVHLDPMLTEGMVDIAFPWRQPECAEGTTQPLCTDYLYSEPMFEMLVVLFTAKGSGVSYKTEADLRGLRVCAPLGHEAGKGAGYLGQVGARLQQPAKAEDCFMRLVSGQVDAVAMNEFTGRVTLKEMRMNDAVELQLSRPLAIETLHAVAAKSNPRGAEMIAALNDGLEKMRASGEYLKVVDKHMSSIWAGL